MRGRSELTWTLLIAAGLALAGCKQPDNSVAMAERLDGFTRSMCECTTKACVDKVNTEATEWSLEQTRSQGPDLEIASRVAGMMEKYTSCMTKVLSEPPPAVEK